MTRIAAEGTSDCLAATPRPAFNVLGDALRDRLDPGTR
jgi:hypothetical protein